MINIKRTGSACLLAMLVTSFSATAQNNAVVKYYDSLWTPAPKESAFYFIRMVQQDSVYRCTAYWMRSQKLNCISTYTDTSFSKCVGLLKRYYEGGQLQDSSFYVNETGKLYNSFHYYENGRLWAHYTYNTRTKQEKNEGYDEKGHRIEDFLYLREAQFKEGGSDWIDYISNNIKAKIPVKKGAPKGTYQVMIRFMVGKDGSLSEISAETNYGYGMEEEAIRVIKKSPRWIPLILLNKEENAFRRQPVTFVVEEQ